VVMSFSCISIFFFLKKKVQICFDIVHQHVSVILGLIIIILIIILILIIIILYLSCVPERETLWLVVWSVGIFLGGYYIVLDLYCIF